MFRMYKAAAVLSALMKMYTIPLNFNCNQLHKNFLSLRDLVLYCGLKSPTEDLVQVDVMPTVVHILWPRSPFSRNIRKSS